jgi:hypothetical protein
VVQSLDRHVPSIAEAVRGVLKRGSKNFLDDLSNSGPAVRLYVEGRAIGPPKD